MSIILKKPETPPELPEEFAAAVGTDGYECLQFFDSCVYDEGKGYNTFKLTARGRSFVLKKYACHEEFEDEVGQYSRLAGLPVPKLVCAADDCILMEFVPGDDLKKPTGAGLAALSSSLAAVMNAWPMGRGYDKKRYERYLRRLEKRAVCLENEPELKAAFEVFFERQKEIPLTLSNGDLLPINVLFDGENAVIIDWEFGGFLPYALDIARFAAHGRPNGEVTGFCLTGDQKRLFYDLTYGALAVKPPRETFDRDLLLAEFNECVEILEYYLNDPAAERGAVFRDYYPRARRLAEMIK